MQRIFHALLLSLVLSACSGETTEEAPPETLGIVLEPSSTFTRILTMENGLAPASLTVSNGQSSFGYIDRTGNWVIEAQYGAATPFSDERAFVTMVDPQQLSPGSQDLELQLIGLDGRRVTETRYDMAFPFKNGMARVKKGEKWGYINTDGENVVDFKFTQVGDFNDGYARVSLNGSSFGIINTQGEYIIDPIYPKLCDFSDGLAFFEDRDGKIGYFNDSGEVAIDFSGSGEVFGGQEGDRKFVSCFSNGLAAIATPNGCGYIDTTGAFVIEPQYMRCKKFKGETAPVRVGDKYVFIDSGGNHLFGRDFDRVFDGLSWWRVKDDQSQKIGAVGNEGEFIEPKFDEVIMIGLGVFAVRDEAQWGFINPDGEYIIPNRFDQIGGEYSNGVVPVSVDGNWGFVGGT